MHTKDILAQELRKIGEERLAKNAEAGLYHDFLSPLTFPDLQLAEDLAEAVKAGNGKAAALRDRHINGEFDASKEESDEWAASADGQEAFNMLRSELHPRGQK